jgi:REP element-mobilizing transposase RayT
MARLPKIVVHGTALFITTSVEEGLLLPVTAAMHTILRSILARAQTLHPVRICHFLVEATHVHMLAIVDNPDDIKGFMERFKTESAHAINSLLGRKKRTVWCEGYDSPVLLTAEDVIRKLVYLYTNPAKDNLTSSISDYPGLSSWIMWRDGKHSFEAPQLRRRDVTLSGTLRYDAVSPEGTSHTFTIYPDAWMECFGIPESERDGINRTILQKIGETERSYQHERHQANRRILGKERMLRQRLDLSYIPQRSGRKMWCICSDVALRKRFIAWAKALTVLAREIYHRWKHGDLSAKFPLGLYPPSFPKHAELINLAVAW